MLNVECRMSNSPFTIHHPPFTIHHSPFTIHHSPFTIHHSPFTIHHSFAPRCTVDLIPRSHPTTTPARDELRSMKHDPRLRPPIDEHRHLRRRRAAGGGRRGEGED